ncbi:hypothetical protein HIM_07271 [Hirsutella minnesotensis 3608]|uniref:Ubiquitin-like domain-containing protein n=1 Tax=Hirsutella minnesotensis 3608 TaxID=1043627 RepID=A0A0F7ZYY2_9HYPO|nr:hypothetical protein HIM_07271 [Hirsutella minnesotensis 3608]
MGCCFSSSAGPNSPYPGGALNASARHINPPSPNQGDGGTPSATAQPAPRRRRRNSRPLDQHINKPLRRHEWTARDRRWTRHDLDLERAEFFDTRVTGRPEIWQTIHAALQILWQPPADNESNDESLDGLATAQSILTAAEISLPTGDLASGVYDSLGNYYQLPQWVVADPRNLAEDGEAPPDVGLSTADEDSLDDDGDDEDDEAMHDMQRRREEKGKAVVDLREQVVLRARLSEPGHDIEISIGKSESVRSITRRITLESTLSPDKKIRLAYMGKMLRDNASLEAQGWQPGHILNAFVFQR